jgi:predicted N-acetyltransferase YhbS
MTSIRHTTPADEPDIRRVYQAAFDRRNGRIIAELAMALLHDPTAQPLLSLLAHDAGQSIGHVLFTRVRIPGCAAPLTAHILAPLGVLPEAQGRGTGAALVRHGLSLLAGFGSALVFVLGHPAYYPRFGFKPAGPLGFAAPYPIEEQNADAWMVLELAPNTLGTIRGAIQCADALNNPEIWCR